MKKKLGNHLILKVYNFKVFNSLEYFSKWFLFVFSVLNIDQYVDQ